MNNQTAQSARHRCRHIFVDGHRCGSASLRGEQFCYYHHTTRRPVANPRARKALRASLQLPIPEDRASIQLSIGLVLERLASNSLDPRRAGLLLYGLQIASSNLPPHQKLPTHSQPLPELPLEDVIADPGHGLLAPPAEALKTRQEMWDDIARERKMLSDHEKDLRQREEDLRRQQVSLLQERIQRDQSSSHQAHPTALVLSNIKAQADSNEVSSPNFVISIRKNTPSICHPERRRSRSRRTCILHPLHRVIPTEARQREADGSPHLAFKAGAGCPISHSLIVAKVDSFAQSPGWKERTALLRAWL